MTVILYQFNSRLVNLHKFWSLLVLSFK